MDVKILHIFPKSKRSIYLQWEIVNPDLDKIEGVTYTVEQSGSPGGPWYVREEDVEGIYYEDVFKDSDGDTEEENLLSLDKQVWYRITANLSNGEKIVSRPVDNFGTLPTLFAKQQAIGLVPEKEDQHPDPQTVFSPHPGVEKRLRLVQRAQQRRALINLRYFSGVHVAVLKRKTFGKRCTNCFDQATKSVTISNCKECYGTGWKDGYYNPVLSMAKIQESPVQTQYDRDAKSEIVRGRLEMMDFPRLKKGDLIVEIDKNWRWVVESVGKRYLKKRFLTQEATCTKVSRAASQYNVDIDRSKLMESIDVIS